MALEFSYKQNNDTIFQDIKHSKNKLFQNIDFQINSLDSHKIWAGCDNVLFFSVFLFAKVAYPAIGI